MKKHNLILLILVLSLVFTALPVYASDIGLGISPEQTATIEDQAAIFTLSITNNGATNTFEIFTLTTDFDLPTETVIISSGETKDVEVRLYPRIHKSGLYEANLLVRNQATRDMKEATARIRLFTLNDALWMRVEPDLLHVDDTKIEFVIKDIADVPIRNLRIEAES
ncbi:MAG: hypothetical protein KJ767_01865, partial [Nanoarchaeota archaeon]|nr:hypothetical protein [Nanoarchaeota archaeon]